MRFQRVAPIISLLWAIAVGLFVLFGPLYASGSGGIAVDKSGNGVAFPINYGHASGLEVNGPWILFVVSVPILLTLAPVLIRRRAVRLVSGSVLLFLCFLAALSIGILYVPAALLLVASGIPKQQPAGIRL